MPWHDITVMISGSAVKDLAKHFVQYWNFANFHFNSQEKNGFMIPIDKPSHLNSIKPHVDKIKQNLI